MSVLKFDGIENARDLGGTRTASGRVVKSGLLYRTALLKPASKKDIERLKELGIKHIYDLRSTHEMTEAPDPEIEGVRSTHVPLVALDGNLFKGMGEDLAGFMFRPAAEMICDGFYLSFIDDDNCQRRFSLLLHYVTESYGEPLLWHCSQGKDRTGLLAAFILFALGADRKTVLDDFAQSNVEYASALQEISEKIRSMGGGEDELRHAQTLVGVNLDEFNLALDHIDKRYGDVMNYISGPLAMSDEDLEKMRNTYLD